MANMGLKSLIAVVLLLSLARPAAAEDSCSAHPKVYPEQTSSSAQEKVKIKADKIEFPERRMVLLKGYTQLIRGGHRVYADELLFNKVQNEVEARGVVRLETPKGDRVETSILTYDVDKAVAVSGPATFTIANRPSEILGSEGSTVNAHGVAERVTFEGDDIMLLKNAQVTSCLDGKEDITFAADELRVDLNEGVRTGKRVKIRIAEPGKHERAQKIIN